MFLKQSRRTTNVQHRLFATATALREERSVAIVGGGLAGLSVAHHLLSKSNDNVNITILDQALVGTGGASSVAGGLLHPFSPSGKLVHWGMEGLQSTNELIDYAARYEPDCVLRNSLYRVAQTPKQALQLQDTCVKHKDVGCKWQSPHAIQQATNITDSMGGILLECGKVIDVPLYLQGLWKSCVHLSNGTATWVNWGNDESSSFCKETLQEFHTVVLCAGAGMFRNNSILDTLVGSKLLLSVQLVRGQSLLLSVPFEFPHAVLCGKYMAPTNQPNKVLVGATHEFQKEPLSPSEVRLDLQERCIAPVGFWNQAETDQVTSGVRVQSNRGKYGRLPIVGQLQDDTTTSTTTWIFTGLSSRGLLHHGLYGEILANAILGLDTLDKKEYSHLRWWRDAMER